MSFQPGDRERKSTGLAGQWRLSITAPGRPRVSTGPTLLYSVLAGHSGQQALPLVVKGGHCRVTQSLHTGEQRTSVTKRPEGLSQVSLGKDWPLE